jgi:hypothetical protein
MTAHERYSHDPGGAVTSTSAAWALRNLRSEFAWKCADAAEAALRFAQRLEPDIDTTTECRRAFDEGVAAAREEYAALARLSGGHRLPVDAPELVWLMSDGDGGRRRF